MFPMRIPLNEWGRIVRDAAKANGCAPKKVTDEDGDLVWVCTCDDELHCGDQQCGIITPESATYRRDGKDPVVPQPSSPPPLECFGKCHA